jgi:transcriptional regulator with XRE-family HTH domain
VVQQAPAGPIASSFAGLLRKLRVEARLTQEELAEKASLSSRSISDLERGISRTARRETARLLADALAIGGSARTAFIAAARGRTPVTDVLPPRGCTDAGTRTATAAWYAAAREDLSLQNSRLIGLIYASTAAATREGRAITGVWLVGVTASASTETASALAETAVASNP